MSAYWRKERGQPPGHPESRFWRAAEDALLGTDTDAAVGRLIGRPWDAASHPFWRNRTLAPKRSTRGQHGLATMKGGASVIT